MITRDLADTNLHLAHYHWVHVTYKNNTSGRERERVNSQTKLSYPESRYLNTSWGAEGLSRMDSSRPGHLGGNCPARFLNTSWGLKTWVELSLSPTAPSGEESIRLKSATVRQELKIPVNYCPDRSSCGLVHDRIPWIALLRKTVWIPGTVLVLGRDICWNETPMGWAFLKNSRWKRRQK